MMIFFTLACTQAIGLPSRLSSAFLCSLFVQSLLVYNCIRFGDYVLYWSHLRAEQLTDAKTASYVAIFLYNNFTQASLVDDSTAVSDVLAFLDDWQPRVYDFGDSFRAAAVTGCVFSLMVFFLAWLTLFLDFRASVLQIRRGMYSFEQRQIRFRHSFTFLGSAVSTNVLNFVLWYGVLFLITFLLAWNFSRGIISDALHAVSWSLMIWGIAFVVEYGVTFLVTSYIGRDKVIHHRYLWMMYDLLTYFSSCVTGIVTALTRIGIALGLLLVAFARMDKSVAASWVDDIMLMDSLTRSYRATILVYHYHNNPVVHVFLKLVSTAADARFSGRADQASGVKCVRDDGSADQVSRVKLRVANRWRKTLFMLQNPSLASYKGEARELDLLVEK